MSLQKINLNQFASKKTLVIFWYIETFPRKTHLKKFQKKNRKNSKRKFLIIHTDIDDMGIKGKVLSSSKKLSYKVYEIS